MKNYLELLQDIIDNGITKEDRTGVGSRSVWGRCLHFDLQEGFPAITTRRVAFRIAFEEAMFMLRGDRNTKILEDKNINIWKGNTSRNFLDARGLEKFEEGDMGYAYGWQWRNFGGWDAGDAPEEWHYSGIDQLTKMIEEIKANPFSRRHVITAWNPQQINDMALPPCHIFQQYQVTPDGKLNSSFFMRSNDVPYGLPYNIMVYGFILTALAKLLGYEPGTLVYQGNDVHVYLNQMDMVKEQLTREVRSLPTLKINKDLNTLDDLLSLEYEDVELIGYDPHPDIKDKPPMAV